MHVIIERVYMPEETLSSLYVFNGEFQAFKCKGLEPAWLDNQRGKSCIKEDTYWVVKEATSPGHPYPHFRVEDKHGRKNVLWHGGNYYSDSQACYLPGSSFGDRNKDGVLDVLNSRKTLQTLYDMLPDKFQCTYREKPKTN